MSKETRAPQTTKIVVILLTKKQGNRKIKDRLNALFSQMYKQTLLIFLLQGFQYHTLDLILPALSAAKNQKHGSQFTQLLKLARWTYVEIPQEIERKFNGWRQETTVTDRQKPRGNKELWLRLDKKKVKCHLPRKKHACSCVWKSPMTEGCCLKVPVLLPQERKGEKKKKKKSESSFRRLSKENLTSRR